MRSEFARLLEDARRGDEEARARLLERFLPDLRAFVRLRSVPIMRQRESQSDLVQTVCARVLADLGGFQGGDEASFRAWLFTAAGHKLTDKARFHGAARRTPEREEGADGAVLQRYSTFATPSRHAMAREEIERIERAFDRLPADHREVILLSCIQGLAHAEIAARMGRSEAAVRKLLSRARARLALLAAGE